jgi:subtilisin-like proprotein convertase family protein
MERGKVTVRTVEAKGLPTAKVVRRLPKGDATRKVLTLRIGKGFSINHDINIIRLENDAEGDVRIMLQSPATVIYSSVESILLD